MLVQYMLSLFVCPIVRLSQVGVLQPRITQATPYDDPVTFSDTKPLGDIPTGNGGTK